MAISLDAQRLREYKDVLWLFMKFGRSDLMSRAAADASGIPDTDTVEDVPEAAEFARALERLGPTYVKLGQLLSTRADLLPAPYLEALTRLQDRVDPFPFADVERIVSTELGVRLSKAFAEFDPTPIAAGSLGQVHRAALRDGRDVAVKVQRPGIREKIAKELEALDEIAGFVDGHTEVGRRYEFKGMLEELRKSLLRELDYRQEATNLRVFAENLEEFDRILVPHPVDDYTTPSVLTMEYISGFKITTLNPVVRIDLDSAELAEQLFHAYLKQMLVDGFFHADPHPGNVFVSKDGHIALIDLGMVARILPGLQAKMLRLLVAIAEGHGEAAADIAITIGEAKEEFDRAGFRRSVADLVARNQGATIDRLDVGREVLEITRISADHGFRLPPEFTMVAKALLNLDQVVLTLDPSFDPNASIRRHASEILERRLLQSLSPSSIVNSVVEVKSFVENLPGKINDILDNVADNKLKITVDAIDEGLLMEGMQKVANRITVGLILAATIVGASSMMKVETSFRIFGYPGLAIVLFLLAAGGGLGLVFNILRTDYQAQRGPRQK